MKWNPIGSGILATKVRSPREFVESLRPSNAQWWEEGLKPWVFRGHGAATWKLLPSAWRPNASVFLAARLEAEKRFGSWRASGGVQHLRWQWLPYHYSEAITFGHRDKELAERLTIDATAELLPVVGFALRANRLGIEIPLDGMPPDPVIDRNWLTMPDHPLVADEFTLRNDRTALLGLAQHHGIQTRFIDWTYDCLAAAFFALQAWEAEQQKHDIAVWALHQRKARQVMHKGVTFTGSADHPPLNPCIDIVRPPNRDNRYLSAQSGLFTTIQYSGIHFMMNEGVRPALEDFVHASDTQHVVLRKLVLPCEHVEGLRELLRREDITRAGLMPTLDNVGADTNADCLAGRWGAY